MVKRKYRISDMHCVNCAMRIEGIEDELPGIKSAAASYARGELVVEFDEKLLDDEKIIAAVKNKGYTAFI